MVDEQVSIANILSTWDRAIELKGKLLEQKRLQKKGLMERLLTGKVRLPGFNAPWIQSRLGDLFDERRETGYIDLALLSITAQNGVIKRGSVNRTDTSSDDKSKYKRIMPLDIGYNTMRMWQGVSGVSEHEGIVSPAYTVLKPKDSVDPHFMGYLFKHPRIINLFWSHSQGLVSDTLNLKYESFRKIRIGFPSDMTEQRSIAGILKGIDYAIAIAEKEIDALKLQKKGLMQLLLTGKVRVPLEEEVL